MLSFVPPFLFSCFDLLKLNQPITMLYLQLTPQQFIDKYKQPTNSHGVKRTAMTCTIKASPSDEKIQLTVGLVGPDA